MASIQIQAKSNRNSLQISIQYPRISNLTYKFQLQVNIYKQTLPAMTYTRVYHNKYLTVKKLVTVKDLQYSTMYKVEVKNKYASQNPVTKNVFVNTPAYVFEEESDQNSYASNFEIQREENEPDFEKKQRKKSKFKKEKVKVNNDELCNSELLLKMIGKGANLQNKDKIHKYILQGRNCRNIEEFINEKNDRRRDRQVVMDKKKLLVKGMLFFQDFYSQKEGHKYFKNDWFMGPFYSYDFNENEIKRS